MLERWSGIPQPGPQYLPCGSAPIAAAGKASEDQKPLVLLQGNMGDNRCIHPETRVYSCNLRPNPRRFKGYNPCTDPFVYLFQQLSLTVLRLGRETFRAAVWVSTARTS